MKNKAYVKAMIGVLSFAKENRKLSNSDGERLAGEWWQSIKADLSHSNVLFLEYGEKVDLITTENVERKLNECKMTLQEIEDEEYDRKIDNKTKIGAYRLAKWSIVISILAATGLPQMIFQWLFELITKALLDK